MLNESKQTYKAESVSEHVYGLLYEKILSGEWPGVLWAMLSTILWMYASMFLVGLLTTITEWKKINASSRQKILYLFTFPVFMMTFVPVAVCAIFCKFQWQPIAHTVAVSVNQVAAGE